LRREGCAGVAFPRFTPGQPDPHPIPALADDSGVCVAARLVALYGTQGQFELEPNPDRGVTASIQIPLMLNDLHMSIPR